MAKNTNDDMAGSISEPKPAKSLWPRPYETVRVEPGLEPPQIEDAGVSAPAVGSPEGDFETVPTEGYQDRAAEPVAEAPDAVPETADDEAPSEPLFADRPAEHVFADEPSRDEPVDAMQNDAGTPVVEIPVEAAESFDPHSEDAAPRVELPSDPEPDPDALRVTEDERTAAVFEAADHQHPALGEPREGRGARLVAMAAGVVVALALGTVAVVYGASGLGLGFGGGSDVADTRQTLPPAEPVPVAAEENDELKAAQDRIAELEAKLKALQETEEAEAAKAAEAAKPAEPAPEQPAEKTAALPPQEPAEPSQPAAKEETPEPAPSADAAKRRDDTVAARESEPAPPPEPPVAEREAVPTPPPAPRRQETARVERDVPVEPRYVPPAPPPRYDTRPSYNEPGASPEMPVLQGWAVRDVYNGLAVVQSGRGAPMEVEPGDELPGGNRVLAIRRLGGNWAVVTERGIIAGY